MSHGHTLARRSCWDSNWVIDLDIKGFVDSIDHTLLMLGLPDPR
jgi:retron-type reverse transcriptase